MVYVPQVAGCSEMDTKHINTQCGQSVQLLNINLVGATPNQ
jgi:hypothetical protein